MEAPQEFVERLERVFGDKYRIRWSDTRNEWLIEQKVRRAVAEGFVNLELRNREQRRHRYDDLIRGRDGYVLTMAIKPGNFTFCPTCNKKMSVPEYDTAAIRCDFCRMRGRSQYQIAGFFPLNESLIDHLRKIDGTTGGHARVNEAINRGNEMLQRSLLADLRRPIEAATRERFNRLVGIPQTGYTGKERAWDKPLGVPFNNRKK